MAILSAVDCGTLHLIPTDDMEETRGDGSSLYDSSVTTTFESADFSAYVPNGTKALLVMISAAASAATVILSLRENGATAANATRKVLTLYGDSRESAFVIIKAPNGIFEYADWGGSNVDDVEINLRGYYI